MVSTENKGRETGTVLSRTLTCSIRGSLNQFAHGGQEAACWSTQNGRINDILGVTELLDGAAYQASAAALIKTAYLLGRRIHGSVEDTKLSTNKQHSLSKSRFSSI